MRNEELVSKLRYSNKLDNNCGPGCRDDRPRSSVKGTEIERSLPIYLGSELVVRNME